MLNPGERAVRPAALVELRKIIREAVPDAEERISYGMPSYHLGGRLACFPAHAKHVGLYPASAGLSVPLPPGGARKNATE